MFLLPEPTQDKQKAGEDRLVPVNRIQGKEHYPGYTDLLEIYRSFHLEDVNSLNLYSPNYITSACIKTALTEIRRKVEKPQS